jgi:hypothetical protein
MVADGKLRFAALLLEVPSRAVGDDSGHQKTGLLPVSDGLPYNICSASALHRKQNDYRHFSAPSHLRTGRR